MSGSGGTGKSHVLQLIQHDICYMLNHTINPDDDQPLVLVTAPMVQLYSRWVDQLSIQHSCCMTSQEPNQAGKNFHHAIEITKTDIINHR